nr:putative mu-like protein [uncultured Mediterranean phage uvMED]
MSVREDIASNVASVIAGITNPAVKKVSRQPFPLEELSQQQYPAVLVQTIEETKEDLELGSGAKTRIANLEFGITGYVKTNDDNIDTARNNLASAIETALETDITRNSNALDTEVLSIETDAGSLFPYGAVLITIRVTYEHQSGTP